MSFKFFEAWNFGHPRRLQHHLDAGLRVARLAGLALGDLEGAEARECAPPAPSFMVFSMCSITASTATPALSLDSSVASATASIKSFLLISTVLVSWEGVGHGGRWTCKSSPGPISAAAGAAASAKQRPKTTAVKRKLREIGPIFRAKPDASPVSIERRSTKDAATRASRPSGKARWRPATCRHPSDSDAGRFHKASLQLRATVRATPMQHRAERRSPALGSPFNRQPQRAISAP